jgi:hypothetical protein
MKEFIWSAIVCIVFLVLITMVFSSLGCTKAQGIRATEAIPLPFPLSIIRGAFTSSSIIKLYPECAQEQSQADCYACIREIQEREGRER